MKPKITIVTCTYNSEKHLRQCIESVNNQTYKNFEHLFIDGLSTDNTIDIIKKYSTNSVLHSSSDKGIYDAFNKGIMLATGDVVGFLHSDDYFSSEFCLERIAEAFLNDSSLDYFASRMIAYDDQQNIEVSILGSPPGERSFRDRMLYFINYAHPTYFCKKHVYNKVGLYDLKYKISSDTDWILRLEAKNFKYFFDTKPLTIFRASGTSSSRMFRTLFEEFVLLRKYNGLSISLIALFFFHLIKRIAHLLLYSAGLKKHAHKIRKITQKFLSKKHM